MNRFLGVCLAALALWVPLGPGSPALAKLSDPDALRGLPGVVLRLNEMPPEVLQAGFTGDDLAARVTARLARAGLPIRAADGPQLVLDARVFHLKAAGLYAFHVELTLEEEAVLKRAERSVSACTWSASTLGTSLSGAFRDTFTGALERLADRFADEYLIVNPKP